MKKQTWAKHWSKWQLFWRILPWRCRDSTITPGLSQIFSPVVSYGEMLCLPCVAISGPCRSVHRYLSKHINTALSLENDDTIVDLVLAEIESFGFFAARQTVVVRSLFLHKIIKQKLSLKCHVFQFYSKNWVVQGVELSGWWGSLKAKEVQKFTENSAACLRFSKGDLLISKISLNFLLDIATEKLIQSSFLTQRSITIVNLSDFFVITTPSDVTFMTELTLLNGS